jgi:hypothetical protein
MDETPAEQAALVAALQTALEWYEPDDKKLYGQTLPLVARVCQAMQALEAKRKQVDAQVHAFWLHHALIEEATAADRLAYEEVRAQSIALEHADCTYQDAILDASEALEAAVAAITVSTPFSDR